MTENRLDRAREFRRLFQVSDDFTVENLRMQVSLITEEYAELRESFASGTPAETLKEIADLKYVLDQFCAFMSWHIDEAEKRVHESNLSKLDENGCVIRREDGKVLKGPNYQPPDLSDLV